MSHKQALEDAEGIGRMIGSLGWLLDRSACENYAQWGPVCYILGEAEAYNLAWLGHQEALEEHKKAKNTSHPTTY